MTLAELALGVHLAPTATVRAPRLRTLETARETYVALPIDATIATIYAELVATVRAAGRRVNILDAWIAATARAHGVPVVTQDDDFDALAVDVIRV